MQVVIQVDAKDEANALALLVRHSPGRALPNRTFVVSEEAVRALREAGIKFTSLSGNSEAHRSQGVPKGEAS